MNIIQIRVDRFLAVKMTPQRAERLLTHLGNVRAEYPAGATPAQIKSVDDGIRLLATKYTEIFLPLPNKAQIPPGAESSIRTIDWESFAHLQRVLRLAWDAPDLRHRKWHIFKARDQYDFYTRRFPLFDERMRGAEDKSAALNADLPPEEQGAFSGPPEMTAFEQAMLHFERIADRARHCLNPECPAPYFFARKKGQKYCSSKCAAPAQREQ